VPALPGDVEDGGGDGEADDRIGDGEAEPDHRGGGDDAQAYDGVGAGVQAVRDQGRAFQSASCADADSRRRRVADEADQARQREGEQVGGREWVDETIYGDPAAMQADTKMAKTTASPAWRSAWAERRMNAIPSGKAVRASPKLWMRSASSATLPVET
jgi:hypothetical protein